MARSILLTLGISVCLGGCGDTIGALDGLPKGRDLSQAEWPRLVDTPAPPEDRLTSGAGATALERLSTQRTSVTARRVKAEAVPPVSEDLVIRADAIRAQGARPVPEIDEAALLARAEQLRVRTKTPAPPINTVTPQRPVPLRPLDQPAVSSGFEERARRALQRAQQVGS